jgi:hypothetical protein
VNRERFTLARKGLFEELEKSKEEAVRRGNKVQAEFIRNRIKELQEVIPQTLGKTDAISGSKSDELQVRDELVAAIAQVTWVSKRPGTWGTFALRPDGFLYSNGDAVPKSRWLAVGKKNGFVVWSNGIVDYLAFDLAQSVLTVYSLGEARAKARWEAKADSAEAAYAKSAAGAELDQIRAIRRASKTLLSKLEIAKDEATTVRQQDEAAALRDRIRELRSYAAVPDEILVRKCLSTVLANMIWKSTQAGAGWSPFALKSDGYMYEIGDKSPKARWVAIDENTGFVVWNKGVVDYSVVDLPQSSMMIYSLGEAQAKVGWEARVRKPR